MMISGNEADATQKASKEQNALDVDTPTATLSPSGNTGPEKRAKLTWQQIAGSLGASFAAASTASSVSFTAVAQPQFEIEDDSNLRMSLETVSWFGKTISCLICKPSKE